MLMATMTQKTHKAMAMIDDLYEIVGKKTENDITSFSVKLNPASRIYAAHFPGTPITPGACIIQSALELTSKLAGKELEIEEIKNVKFLNILSPIDNPIVEFVFKPLTVEGETIKAKVEVKDKDKTFTTISILCR